ncbi:MAG: hypothetical protein COZ80_02280 [Ignavibacteria bacterium CG_4_8_14_3_um_filter_37_9]|nr:MAG: hypothetical protein AUJ54_02650 [Ignavibacteria bacterium CG1_02_37_35]PIS45718.1 MAG: hypothetical protein COT22_03790 [Ignavibacteria bacterium CG08_land_8_20_14_0_20_37_9]PIX00033.1 MAG: hypothetical protein COZ80_02280 [Ignavibacteria bacterium CG_4_8_14_3_um_filter_37_9]PIX95223.1 MAG: hypothetical protein COZ25_01535 [Ignavibacteria bacterium CG_4_10_14_3_um_filter_37_18]PJC57523.1 MAG: hypothetical protein CO025_12915 [Ignavibacteria bacterium CG_4_9_14_0_2_um_filter_37_13]
MKSTFIVRNYLFEIKISDLKDDGCYGDLYKTNITINKFKKNRRQIIIKMRVGVEPRLSISLQIKIIYDIQVV